MIKIIFSLFLLFLPTLCHSTTLDELNSYSQAWTYINKGDNNSAITYLSSISSKNPTWGYVNVLKGLAFFNKKDYPNACIFLKKFLSDPKQETESSSENYNLAILYYLRAANKQRDAIDVKKYYLLLNDQDISGFDNKFLEALIFVEIASKDFHAEGDRIIYCNKAISLLNSFAIEGVNKTWFNNTYGRALIIHQSFYTNFTEKEKQVAELKIAKKYFLNEINLNPDSIVYVNLSIACRLIGEHSDSNLQFSRRSNSYQNENNALDAYQNYKDACNFIDKAKLAKNFDQYPEDLLKVGHYNHKVFQEFINRSKIKVILSKYLRNNNGDLITDGKGNYIRVNN